MVKVRGESPNRNNFKPHVERSDAQGLKSTEMVIPDGESSNQIDELFNELSRWNDVLKDTSIAMKPPSP